MLDVATEPFNKNYLRTPDKQTPTLQILRRTNRLNFETLRLVAKYLILLAINPKIRKSIVQVSKNIEAFLANFA